MAEYKDVTSLKKEIVDFKKHINSSNSNYLTGYICALSATEVMIANLPNADVVEVVRCKDCVHYLPDKKHGLLHSPCSRIFAMGICHEDSFCSYGERKEQG